MSSCLYILLLSSQLEKKKKQVTHSPVEGDYASVPTISIAIRFSRRQCEGLLHITPLHFATERQRWHNLSSRTQTHEKLAGIRPPRILRTVPSDHGCDGGGRSLTVWQNLGGSSVVNTDVNVFFKLHGRGLSESVSFLKKSLCARYLYMC